MWGIIQKDSIDRLIQKIRSLTTRVETLESGGGSSTTLLGDVTGTTSSTVISTIQGVTLDSAPLTGDVLLYDATADKLKYGRTPFNNIQTLSESGNINETTQLVIVDLDNSPGGTLNIVLPTLTPMMQFIAIKLLGATSTALVSLDTLASNGFDPTTGQATVSSLQNLGRGTIVIVAPDYANNCWWNLGVTYI